MTTPTVNAPVSMANPQSPSGAVLILPDANGQWRVIPCDTSGNMLISSGTLLAGEVSQDSATSSYVRSYGPLNVICCDGTSAVPIGGGNANDTMIIGVFIEKNAGPGVVTIAGFGKATNSSGTYTAKSMTIQGSTSLDVSFFPQVGLVNNVGAATVTCTVDEIAWVFWRALS